MNQITLSKFVEDKGQAFVAKALGVSSPAVSKALSVNRDILVTFNADGTYEAIEVREFPSQKPKSTSAA